MKFMLSCIPVFLISIATTLAQTTTLHLVDEFDIPVPFAGVYDSLQKIFLSSDSSGYIILPEGRT